MTILFFDTETTDMWDFKGRTLDPKQPNLAQIGALLTDDNGREMASFTSLIYPEDDWIMAPGAQNVHGISMEDMETYGIGLSTACRTFDDMLNAADIAVGHNVKFDIRVMRKAYNVAGSDKNPFEDCEDLDVQCTMLTATPVCQIPKARGAGSKWPKLEECMKYFFNEDMNGTAHDAMADTRACSRVYFALKELGHFGD